MKKEFSKQERVELANRIKYVRMEIAHQTQSEFAFSLYVSRVYINQLENAKTTAFPTTAFFQRICDKYAVYNDWIQFGNEPILQNETSNSPISNPLLTDEELVMMQYRNRHFDIPEGQLYYDKMLAAHYDSILSLELKELLDPKDLSIEQYNQLMSTFITLYQPFLQFVKDIKENFKDKNSNSIYLYEEYLQNLEAAIKVFFPN